MGQHDAGGDRLTRWDKSFLLLFFKKEDLAFSLSPNEGPPTRVTKANPDHDALYHRFFSDGAVVAQLLREFAAGPHLDGLDLNALERVRRRCGT